MYAFVFAYSVAPENQAAFAVQGAEFWAVRAKQPGFRGTIRVDLGAGRTVSVILWDSPEAQLAAEPAMVRPHDHVRALITRQLLGRGAVVRDTVTPGAAPRYARLAETTYTPGGWAAAQAQRDEYVGLAAQQPGFRGVMQVDAGAGRYLTLSLWASQAQSEAAGPVLATAVDRLGGPWFAAPLRVLGIGVVVSDSLTPLTATA